MRYLFTGPGRKQAVRTWTGDSWTENNFADTTSIKFPNSDYTIAAGSTHLYAVGGRLDSDQNTPLNTVFKSEDGYNWEKLPWTMGKGRSGATTGLFACITKNADSGKENLVVMGGLGAADDVEIKVYDLEDGSVATEISDAPFLVSTPTNQLVCNNGWMYVADKDFNFHSMEVRDGRTRSHIATASFAKVAKGGQLVVYDVDGNDRVGLVGGKKEGDHNIVEDQENFVYNAFGKWNEGGEFPAWKQASPSNKLVLVTK